MGPYNLITNRCLSPTQWNPRREACPRFLLEPIFINSELTRNCTIFVQYCDVALVCMRRARMSSFTSTPRGTWLLLIPRSTWITALITIRCAFCKSFEPVFEALHAHYDYDEGMFIAKIDASMNEVAASGIHVKGFPTMYFLKANDKLNPIEYASERTFTAIITFIEEFRSTSSKISASEIKRRQEISTVAKPSHEDDL